MFGQGMADDCDCRDTTKRDLRPGQIVCEFDNRTVFDEIDPDYPHGLYQMGFEYRSKLTGNIVILHPSQLKYLTYKKPTKKE